jgi:putative tricarboxylic transport membrane protein
VQARQMLYERLTAVIIAVGGGVIMYYAWSDLKIGEIQVPGAGFLPFLTGAGLSILAIIWALTSPRTAEQQNESLVEERRWQRPVWSFVLMLLFVWSIEMVGFNTATFIFMMTWQKLIEREKWIKAFVISLLAMMIMYALFVYLLKVPVPQELFLR